MTFDYSIEVNRSFKYAVIFSIIFHALAVLNWPFYRYLFSDKSQFKEIEITYLRTQEPPAPKKPEAAVKRSQPQLESAQPAKIVSEELPKAGQPKKTEPAASKKNISEIKKDEAKIENKPAPEQRAKVVVKQTVIPKTETTASVDLKEMRLVPPSYAQTVRSRIIDNLNSEDSESDGDVFVRFVITAKGELKDINIIDEKSSKEGSLRRMAFEAVRDSSPFPKFPKDVLAPEITFTCQISFIRK